MTRLIRSIKFLLIIVTLIIFKKSITAQKYSLAPSIGIRGGLSMSSIKGDKVFDEFDRKKALNFEFFGNYYLSRYLSLQSGIAYDLKGAEFESCELKTDLHYLVVPLYVKYQFFKDPVFYIYGGGYFGYLFMANTKGEYSDLDDSYNVNENIKSNVSDIDYGLSLGGGVQSRYSAHIDLFMDLRYSVGLKPINNCSEEIRYNFSKTMRYEYEIDNPTNKSIYITAGIIYYFVPR